MAYTCPSCHVVYPAKPPGTNACGICMTGTEACPACGADCPECGMWACKAHHKTCLACGDEFCDDHVDTCGSCSNEVCNGCSEEVPGCTFCQGDGCVCCLETCPVCEQRYCSECMGKCTNCGNDACRGHMFLIPHQKGQQCQTCIDAQFPGVNPLLACEKAVVKDVDDSVLEDFEPEIIFFLYKQRKSKAGKDAKPSTGDWQAEHPIPNSCFIKGSGRSGPTVPNSGTYAEAEALCFWVEDDQTHGTEHKFITDYEREFTNYCQTKNEYPTVEQWFQVMENGWKEMILQHREYVGPEGSNATETDNLRQAAAARAAHAMRVKLQKHYFKTLKVSSSNCYTKIGFQNGSVPQPNLKGQTAFKGF